MLNEKTLKSSIESGSLLPVYLIAGDDLFLKKQALDRIIKATVDPDDDMNLVRFEYGVALQQVYDELNGFPLMADKKCVVYSEFDFEDEFINFHDEGDYIEAVGSYDCECGETLTVRAYFQWDGEVEVS